MIKAIPRHAANIDMMTPFFLPKTSDRVIPKNNPNDAPTKSDYIIIATSLVDWHKLY